ncbi:uncharacterized protein LOC583352 [Strongylocentrotus purpuratus]|uniref:Uncharacterized protein n=1 Tax=Strongylocentrotus purpuratus TaxID=7668 RepID=A0A7M7RHJ5_STRPU|nr:uncharacterized protein LOC583352 [Strongylocentrotus purpuratus]|eukprot:XP_800222.1 PREDICTED: uncharacterized protein LOC583352 [Strongylocentrotus purpuratus]
MTSSTFPQITPTVKQAIDGGDAIALERMLKAGLDPNMIETQTDNGVKSQHSALILAISLNQIEVADLLIKAGAAVDTIFLNYDSANKCMYELSALATTRMLYEFTLSNTLGAMLSTLEEGLQKTQGREPRKVPPVDLPKDVPNEVLVDSVREGDLDSVTILLSHGMDVNLVHIDGETGYAMSILILSIIRRRYSVAAFLLNKGAECETVYLNYDKSEDNVVDLTALSAAERVKAKFPSKELNAFIHLLAEALGKVTGEPRIMPSNDIPKAKLEVLPRYRKKVPRIFIASVNEEEVEEIKAWDSVSVGSVNDNGRGHIYKETADDVDDDQENNTVSSMSTDDHHDSRLIHNGKKKDEISNQQSSTCVIL